MKITDLLYKIKFLVATTLVIGSILGISSCADTKKLVYFPNVNDSSLKIDAQNRQFIPTETIIQVDDILSITVSSANPEASIQFNAPNESTPSTNSASQGNTLTIGYLVNQNGDILFPVLGTIHVEGLTKLELSQKITKELLDRKLLVDPIVTIRYLNFRVSVIGEVAKPGVYTVPNEKLSILEALGLAGDLTIYGKRENVLLIREDGKEGKITKRISLFDQNILTSPYYYLKSNDIIYVEPIRDRVSMERSQRLLPIIFSITSLGIIILDRIVR